MHNSKSSLNTWHDKLLTFSLVLVLLKNSTGAIGVPIPLLPVWLAYLFAGLVYIFVTIVSNKPLGKIDFKAIALVVILAMLIFRGTLNSSRPFPAVEHELLTACALILISACISRLISRGFLGYLLEWCIKGSFMVGLIGSIVGLRRIISGTGDSSLFLDEGGATSSLVADYNMSSLVILIGLLSGLSLFRQTTHRLMRIGYLPCLIIIAFAPLLSGSRRYILFFGFAVVLTIFYLLYFLVAKWRTLSLQLRGIAATGFTILSVFLIVLGLAVAGNFDTFLSANPSHPVTSVIRRYETIGQFKETVKDSRGILLGRGLEIFESKSFDKQLLGDGFDYLDKMSETGDDVYPHNPVVSALLYSGLVGAIIVGVFIFMPLFRIREIFRKSFWVGGSYIASLFFAIVSGNTYADIFVFPFFCLMARSVLWSEGIIHELGSEAGWDPVAPAN
jgi:uncharacterized membrane protein